MKRDQKFFDMYSLVIGVLAFVALLLWVGAKELSKMTQDVYTADTEEYQAAVRDRIRPFGRAYLPGEAMETAAPRVEEAPPVEPVKTAMTGPQVYNTACLVCHGAGVGGAPVVGNAEAWAPRIAQGNDTLYQHAIEGFTGQMGYMPPKGARMDLSDEEVRGAVDYMVGESGD